MKKIIGLILFAGLAVNAFLAYRTWNEHPKTDDVRHSTDAKVVMGTKGGLLEVSTITSQEHFSATNNFTILGVPVGNVVAQIRVPAVYRYHIPLATDWTLRYSGATLIVIAPRVRPSLPVAIDTGKLQAFAGGMWSPWKGAGAIAALQKQITANLEVKASNPDMLMLQRETARKTVTEFIDNWVVKQPLWKGAKTPVVLVFFEDEPLGEKAAPLLASFPYLLSSNRTKGIF